MLVRGLLRCWYEVNYDAGMNEVYYDAGMNEVCYDAGTRSTTMLA